MDNKLIIINMLEFIKATRCRFTSNSLCFEWVSKRERERESSDEISIEWAVVQLSQHVLQLHIWNTWKHVMMLRGYFAFQHIVDGGERKTKRDPHSRARASSLSMLHVHVCMSCYYYYYYVCTLFSIHLFCSNACCSPLSLSLNFYSIHNVCAMNTHWALLEWWLTRCQLLERWVRMKYECGREKGKEGEREEDDDVRKWVKVASRWI